MVVCMNDRPDARDAPSTTQRRSFALGAPLLLLSGCRAFERRYPRFGDPRLHPRDDVGQPQQPRRREVGAAGAARDLRRERRRPVPPRASGRRRDEVDASDRERASTASREPSTPFPSSRRNSSTTRASSARPTAATARATKRYARLLAVIIARTVELPRADANAAKARQAALANAVKARLVMLAPEQGGRHRAAVFGRVAATKSDEAARARELPR